nr:unnamed protein product [Naegleria fowleri]
MSTQPTSQLSSSVITSSDSSLNVASKVLVLCGVCGCGKSSIATKIIEYLNSNSHITGLSPNDYTFIEGDTFHSVSNIEKMKNGIPLTDNDRKPWLLAIHLQIMNEIKHNRKLIIVTCSALKHQYRELLIAGDNYLCEREEDILNQPIIANENMTLPQQSLNVKWYFVHLTTNKDVISQRMQERTGHYMNPSLIQSQFDCLDMIPFDPQRFPNAILVSVENEGPMDMVVDNILSFVLHK